MKEKEEFIVSYVAWSLLSMGKRITAHFIIAGHSTIKMIPGVNANVASILKFNVLIKARRLSAENWFIDYALKEN